MDRQKNIYSPAQLSLAFKKLPCSELPFDFVFLAASSKFDEASAAQVVHAALDTHIVVDTMDIRFANSCAVCFFFLVRKRHVY